MTSKSIEIERETLARLFQLSNKLQNYLDQQLKNDNISAKQLFLMIVLGSFDSDPGFSEISERFGTSRQNVKQLALKLEKNGYVDLYTDEKDSRFKRIRFTKKAFEYWKKRDEMDMMILHRMFDGLSTEQMLLLQDAMRAINANIYALNSQEMNSENGN